MQLNIRGSAPPLKYYKTAPRVNQWQITIYICPHSLKKNPGSASGAPPPHQVMWACPQKIWNYMKEIDNLGCFERIFLSNYSCEICDFFFPFFWGGGAAPPSPPFFGAPGHPNTNLELMSHFNCLIQQIMTHWFWQHSLVITLLLLVVKLSITTINTSKYDTPGLTVFFSIAFVVSSKCQPGLFCCLIPNHLWGLDLGLERFLSLFVH